MGGDIRAMMYAFEVAMAADGACVAFARLAWSMWNRYLYRESALLGVQNRRDGAGAGQPWLP
jgi:hypothetical protein